MNKNSLVRKIAYIVAIVSLLLPLFALGSPGSGLIGQLRTKYKMGQASFGKLDPTSESMRLATLGMKGIASTILWLRADYYKEEKYFDRFSATLNQISLLQPHFISVWEFQAHNLGYNVAPEFEDYRQRFEWIKKGIDYLIRGTKFNERKPMLQYVLGQQYFGSKMGRADEKVQYRSMFSNDAEFHSYLKDQGLVGIDTTARGYDQKPDNWLTGKLWLNQATDLYEAGATIKKSPHLLYSYSPAWQMYYADAIETEGILDASASLAWKQGGDEWAQFGTKSLFQLGQGRDMTMLGDVNIAREVESIQSELDIITSNAMPKAVELLRKSLTAEELKIYDTPSAERDPANDSSYYSIATRLTPTAQQVALQVDPKEQVRALNLSTKLANTKEFLRLTESYRSQVNYAYWELRAKVEQNDEMVKARRFTYEADKLIDVADVKGALDLYEKAWVQWDWVFRRFPTMMTDDVGDDVQKSLLRYKKLVDRDLEESFILSEFLQIRQYSATGMGGDAQQIIDEWQRKAASLGNEPPSEAPLKPTDTPKKQSVADPATASVKQPGNELEKETTPAKEPPAKESPAVSPVEKEEMPPRPPTLENPDIQE